MEKWEIELNEYLSRGNPTEIERSGLWKIAIGLQTVDGLKVSEFLLNTAKEHIEGKISIDEACRRIEEHYKDR